MTTDQRAALDTMLRGAGSIPGSSVEEQRESFAQLMGLFPVPDLPLSETVLGGLRTLVVGDPGPALLYLHGGAFTAGSPETGLPLAAQLVARTGMRAYVVDYPLAPEHPFPAAITACVEAYRELAGWAGRDPARETGATTAPVAIAGDSAGGGLAVSTTLAARAADLPAPAAVVTFSATLDCTLTGSTVTSKVDQDPQFSPEGLAGSVELYLGGADPHQPWASPAVLGDLSGFPPLLLQVGGNELLLDDSFRLAARAADAGVDVALEVTGGVPHVFQMFSGMLDEAGAALDHAARFLQEHTA
jgi:epsilon-lactone hydrolase